jgi:hypothetical protein
MIIDLKEQPPKAFDSIRFNRESGSKERLSKDQHSLKHSDPRTSTLRGMIIDFKEER